MLYYISEKKQAALDQKAWPAPAIVAWNLSLGCRSVYIFSTNTAEANK